MSLDRIVGAALSSQIKGLRKAGFNVHERINFLNGDPTLREVVMNNGNIAEYRKQQEFLLRVNSRNIALDRRFKDLRHNYISRLEEQLHEIKYNKGAEYRLTKADVFGAVNALGQRVNSERVWSFLVQRQAIDNFSAELYDRLLGYEKPVVEESKGFLGYLLKPAYAVVPLLVCIAGAAFAGCGGDGGSSPINNHGNGADGGLEFDSGNASQDIGYIDDDSGLDKDIGVEDKDVPQYDDVGGEGEDVPQLPDVPKYDGGDAGIDIGIPDEDAGDGGIGNDVPEYDAGDGGEDVPQLPDVEKYDGETPDGELDAGQDSGVDAGTDAGIDSGVDAGRNCIENETRDYYPADPNTKGKGECKGGIETCIENEFVVTKQPTVPLPEVVGNGKDDDCDGKTDEVCTSGEKLDMPYNGQPGTDGVGICTHEIKTCDLTGHYETTTQEVLPNPTDIPNNSLDDDCDNKTDECNKDETKPYYTGLPGTEGKGICKAGVKTCDISGNWNITIFDILPNSTDIAGNLKDDDCDNLTDECNNGETITYFTVLPEQRNKGECKDGTKTCDATGNYNITTFEITPIAEICSNGKDEDCNGTADNGCTTNLNITVHVSNVVTSANLSGIEVILNSVSQTTNSSGNTTFTLPAGTYPLVVRDESSVGVIGSFFDKEYNVNLTTSTTLEEEVIENYTAPPEYANFLAMLKKMNFCDGSNTIISRWSSTPIDVYIPDYTYSGIDYKQLAQQALQRWEDATVAKPGLQLFQQVATEDEALDGIIFDYSQINSSADPYVNANNIIEDAIIYVKNNWSSSDRVLLDHKHELGHALGNFDHNLNPNYIMNAGVGIIDIHQNEGYMVIIISTIKDTDMSHYKED